MCTMVAQDELTFVQGALLEGNHTRNGHATAIGFEVLKDSNAFNILFPQHFDPHEVQNASSSEPMTLGHGVLFMSSRRQFKRTD